MINRFLVRTYLIVKYTNLAEYNALSDANKEKYKIIVSTSSADLAEGSSLKDMLWDMFPEGTITGDNFRNVDNGLVPNLLSE